MVPKKKRNKKKAEKKQEHIYMTYELKKATRDMERNRRLIEAGETFRSQKRRGPEKAPSHYKPMV